MTLLEVGRIVKPHGIRGEVIVDLTTNRTERVEPGTRLQTDNGELTVERSSSHQGRWIVAFEGVATRNDADALRGVVLRAEPVAAGEGELFVHEMIGAPVADTTGAALGVVTEVEANPASDLLVLDTGGLVPLTFFVRRDDDGTIVVDPPAGLLELDAD